MIYLWIVVLSNICFVANNVIFFMKTSYWYVWRNFVPLKLRNLMKFQWLYLIYNAIRYCKLGSGQQILLFFMHNNLLNNNLWIMGLWYPYNVICQLCKLLGLKRAIKDLRAKCTLENKQWRIRKKNVVTYTFVVKCVNNYKKLQDIWFQFEIRPYWKWR